MLYFGSMSDELKTPPILLLVDDWQTNIRTLAEALREEYSLRFATNGQEALELLQQGLRPDMILLDVVIPEMDGFSVCSQIKGNPLTTDIPVIFVTSMDDGINEEHGFEVGAVDYISKPIKPAVVRARVRLHLELKKHREFLQRLVESRTDDLNSAKHDARELLTFISDQMMNMPK